MNILAVDTSTNYLAITLMKDDKIVVDVAVDLGRNHSAFIMNAINRTLTEYGVDIADIDYYVCGTGPGSFTGTRIGVVTIKTLAQVNNKPCIGVDSLYAMCTSAKFFDGVVVTAIDARNNRVFMCATEGVDTLIETDIYTVEEMMEKLSTICDSILVLGDGAKIYQWEFLESTLRVQLDKRRIFHGVFLIEAAMERIKEKDFDTYESLLPNYILKSQAERERDASN